MKQWYALYVLSCSVRCMSYEVLILKNITMIKVLCRLGIIITNMKLIPYTIFQHNEMIDID